MVKLTPSCWRYSAPLGAGRVFCYVLGTPPTVLVDTGYAEHPTSALAPWLASSGRGLRHVDAILTTHVHLDHAGGHAAVLRHSNARVAVHPGDAHGCGDADHFSRSELELSATLERVGRIREARQRRRFVAAHWSGPFTIHHRLADGQRFRLDGVAIQVIHTPGHTPGSVSFLLEEEGLLLAGDAVQGWGPASGIWPLVADPNSYLQSLRRVDEVGAGALALGHAFTGAPTASTPAPLVAGADAAELLRDSRQFIECAMEAATQVLSTGPGPAHSMVVAVVGLVQRALGLPEARPGPFAVFTALACLTARGYSIDPDTTGTELG